MGMPTPHVEPSPSRIRTCTGFPDGGEGEADGPVDAPAEAAPPACQVAPGDDPPQAAERASVTPSTAAVSADRHERERLMTATMLRTGRIHQVARTVRTRSPPKDRHDRRTPVTRWPPGVSRTGHRFRFAGAGATDRRGVLLADLAGRKPHDPRRGQ